MTGTTEHGHETMLLPRNRKDKFRGGQRALFLLQLCLSFLPLLSLAGSPMTTGRTRAPGRCGFCRPGAKPGSPSTRRCRRPVPAVPGEQTQPCCGTGCGSSSGKHQHLLGKDVKGFGWTASSKP